MHKVTAAVIEEGGRVLIARRKAAARFGGLWEFPGGKLEPGEAPETGLRRELLEELGVETRIGAFLGAFPYESSQLSIELLAYRVSIEGGGLRPVDHDEIVWAPPGDLSGYEFTEPDRPLVVLLAGGIHIMSETRPESAAVLQPGKDKPVRNRHPWIFSGAVRSLPEFENGGILPVHAADGEFLGHAYFNRKTSIAGRMLNFDRTPPLEALAANIDAALALRRRFFGPETTAYRLVNGEGDGVPGLVADLYGDVLVLQISTLGLDRLKAFVLDHLTKRLAPRSVYEKSHLPTRREEGLPMFDGLLQGEEAETVEVLENGLRFRVDIVHGQKTGFYLDQREMREFARRLAAGRRVLNAFAYTGGFSVHAFAGGAASVDSVEASDRATAAARENCRLNGFAEKPGRFLTADVFEFVRAEPLDYDLVVLDPPAFAKKKAEVVRACRGYKDIHRIVFQKVPAGSLVLTFSCSYFVDETLFRQVLFQAAREASRNVRILQRHHQAFDHPVSIYHPESDYLKGFLLEVE